MKEKQTDIKIEKKSNPLFSFLDYWKTSPVVYRKLSIGLLAFTLFNSSDVFILLKAKQSGLSDTMVIGAYIFYNIVYALSSFPIGILADKAGLKKIYISGLFIFSIVYFGLSTEIKPYTFFILFLLYGVYASATEGISKAWITNVVNRKDTATAIGTYSAFQSICTMIASTLAGLIWFEFGAAFTFIITAIATLLIIFYFIIMIPHPENEIHKMSK